MVNLDDVAGFSALKILEKYEGKNPYIKTLKKEFLKNNKVNFTPQQRRYIVDNHDKDPIYVNRVVSITQYLGEVLQKDHKLTFTPEKILIEYILADSEKTFHIFGKLKKNGLVEHVNYKNSDLVSNHGHTIKTYRWKKC